MKSICVMREIYKALDTYERAFEGAYGVCLNEAMALCALSYQKEKITSSMIAEKTGMSLSHTSKVLRLLESKELIKRSLGKEDKRQMYFALTQNGRIALEPMTEESIEIPELLKPVFEKNCLLPDEQG